MTKPKDSFDSPFDNLSASTAQRATESKSVRAGQYRRKTITLPPGQIELISQLATNSGIGILAFYRWLIDQGLKSYDDGNKPQIAPKPSHDIKSEHWSSK